ncbi:MAG: peptidase [Harvfovirus sp.]|uniref:Peptidase n=1 Tax=Harvfovirus sp. TaxID=2487768 RepID=A0A3G5A253_9VIRU|nr:MAG: peptidase [Harvfovirus sp.]
MERQYGNWDDLCYNKKKINDEIDILLQRSKNAREFILNTNHSTSDNVQKIIATLADDTYEFNSFHSLCKLLKMVSPNKDIRTLWDKTDKLLSSHVEKFNSDRELFNKLSQVSTYVDDSIDRLFVDKILKGFEKYGFFSKSSGKAIVDVLHEIHSWEEKMSVEPIHLHSLITLRSKYVKLLGYETYMGFKSSLDMVSLKNTLCKIISDDIDTRCYNELQTISQSLQKPKISSVDILLYREKLMNKYTINLFTALNEVINLISEIFQLNFIKQKQSYVKTWEQNVLVYVIKYKNETYGHLYVDLIKDLRLEKITQPISLNLHECVHYPNESKVFKLPVIVLLGNLDAERITYLDVINIFKEMGAIVQTLFHRSKYENINVDCYMRSFMGYLFEHIAFDLDTVKRFFPRYALSIHRGLICDRAFKLKQQCIATLFDCVVHGTKIFDNWESLVLEYDNIYRAIMNKSLQQCVSQNFPNNLAVNLIFNGGIIYSEITNGIMAYNLYVLLKETNGFSRFVNKVLRETLVSFDVGVASFIDEGGCVDKKKEHMCYLSDEERCVSENTNYFTDN